MTPFIHYITSWYTDPDAARCSEQAGAMTAQASGPAVRTVSVLSVDDGCPIPAAITDHRPTFAELAALGSDDDGTVNLLTNTDCFIDPEDAAKLAAIAIGEVYCLSRQDNIHKMSQDAWAWRGRLSVPMAAYTQGVLGCDNRFAFDCLMAGRLPSNPAKSICLHHRHASQVRRYTECNRLSQPYLFVGVGEQSGDIDLELLGNPADRQRMDNALRLMVARYEWTGDMQARVTR